MSQTKTPELNEELKEALETLLDDALEAKNSTLSKEEKHALLQKVMTKRNVRGYVKTRNARRLREAKKLQRERAAKVASSVALTVGGTAAGSMLLALAVPSAPALAVAGAFAGLLGGAWSAWVTGHPSEDDKKQTKNRT
ncbi:TPA: hypothetical protein QDZ28_003467 [Pseudomonas putida]|nr:hypothetical protein [Pseudomonas putida]